MLREFFNFVFLRRSGRPNTGRRHGARKGRGFWPEKAACPLESCREGASSVAQANERFLIFSFFA
jgi:hypothetical protein